MAIRRNEAGKAAGSRRTTSSRTARAGPASRAMSGVRPWTWPEGSPRLVVRQEEDPAAVGVDACAPAEVAVCERAALPQRRQQLPLIRGELRRGLVVRERPDVEPVAERVRQTKDRGQRLGRRRFLATRVRLAPVRGRPTVHFLFLLFFVSFPLLFFLFFLFSLSLFFFFFSFFFPFFFFFFSSFFFFF